MRDPNIRRIRMWHDALLNGQYTRGTGRLATETMLADGPDAGTVRRTHCCLGVATEIARKGYSGGLNVESPVSTFSVPAGLNSWFQMGDLPAEVAAWYGIERNPVLETPDGHENIASNLNDVEGYSFEQIAEAIARTWPAILNPEYD